MQATYYTLLVPENLLIKIQFLIKMVFHFKKLRDPLI